MANKERAQWGSNLGFLMATVGSAVGLGNLWAFPYKMGANGGFAFLIIYLILVVLIGFIVMLGELTLGRKSGYGTVGAYKTLSKKFKWVGWFGVLAAFLITAFYSVLGGYCVKYIIVNFGDLIHAGFGTNGMDGGTVFSTFLTSPVQGVVYLIIFLGLAALIVMRGISHGIEKFTKFAMPALFVMLIVVIVRAVTLPGAAEGLAFMFQPNFDPLKENFIKVLSVAGSQVFFSLSLGMGITITYGSYMTKDQSLEKNALIIPLADTIVALLAGMAVLPAAFALGGADAALAGPKLLFITLQNVFANMGAIGPLFGVVFYFLVFIAAITSAISLIEVCTTFFLDNAHLKGKEGNRKKITASVCAALLLLGSLVAVDGLGSNGVWVPFQQSVGVLGFNDCWLDFLDFFSEGIMMPIGALFMSLFIGYEMGVDEFAKEVRANGNSFKSYGFFKFCIRYIVPIAMVFILLGQLDSFLSLGIF